MDPECQGDELEENDRLDVLTNYDEGAQLSENILKVDSRPSKQLYAWVKIKPGSTRIKFQVDTGATCNLIRRSDLPNAVRINKSEKTTLHYYNGTKNESLGSCQLTLETQDGKTSEQQFQVVTNGATSLIGVRAAQEMSIISVNKECVLQLLQNARVA